MKKEMTLSEVADAAGDVLVGVSDASATIAGLAYDSRRVLPGHLFFCIPGTVSDGHSFAGAAAAAGATALCVERPTGAGLPEVVVRDGRRALARIAAAYYDRPGARLSLIGVTGTNGKTTTSFLTESILAASGRTTGLIGTVETRIAGKRQAGVRTTPDSLELQALLADMVAAGVDSVVMEVTSHGLVLQRVEGLKFAAACFTNLSQDHLDFHSSMEDYFAAKRSLFVTERAAKGAINIDDPYGRKLKEATEIETITFGHSPDADVRAEEVAFAASGTEFVMTIAGEEIKVRSPLVGAFNVSNCLAAAAAAFQAGVPLSAIETGLARVGAVPGRFEAVDEGQPFTVVVDYAHTPDSLDNVLREARRLARARASEAGASGRVACVFGAGGDRDRGKRPLMGAAAARRADVVVVTSDNPRSEDPLAIIEQILEGVIAEKPQGPDAVLPDRREAIAFALSAARAGDVVVIAGKGHETGQQFADRTIPFDDRLVARDELRARGFRA